MRKKKLFLYILIFFTLKAVAAPVGTIQSLIGTTEISPAQKPAWKPARPGMKVFADDKLRTSEESTIEIQWSDGGIVRMAEKSTLIIEAPILSGTEVSNAKLLTGKVWVNMKTMTGSGKKFDVSTPTATAGIRGTIFRVNAEADSSTEVLVYEGKVAVGPTDILKKQDTVRTDSSGRWEIAPPGEIDGPQEVTLEDWVTIVAGQQIRVESSGIFKTWQFEQEQDSLDSWVKFNREKDSAAK